MDVTQSEKSLPGLGKQLPQNPCFNERFLNIQNLLSSVDTHENLLFYHCVCPEITRP